MHGHHPHHSQHHNVRRSRSIWFWGLLLPLLILLLAWPTRGWSFAGLLAYPALGTRIYRHRRRQYRDPPRHAVLYSTLCVLGKIPEAIGQIRYLYHRRRRQPARLIEYKRTSSP